MTTTDASTRASVSGRFGSAAEESNGRSSHSKSRPFSICGAPVRGSIGISRGMEIGPAFQKRVDRVGTFVAVEHPGEPEVVGEGFGAAPLAEDLGEGPGVARPLGAPGGEERDDAVEAGDRFGVRAQPGAAKGEIEPGVGVGGVVAGQGGEHGGRGTQVVEPLAPEPGVPAGAGGVVGRGLEPVDGPSRSEVGGSPRLRASASASIASRAAASSGSTRRARCHEAQAAIGR